MRRRGRLWGAALALGAYAASLGLLVAAERGAEGATIVSLPRALWYSFVTLTTVGYGDLYPVTAAGKVIGGVFLVLSTGVLALLVGLILSAVTGRLFPRLRLWRNRRQRWDVFSGDNAASRALAAGLDDGLAVFLGPRAGEGAGEWVWLDMTPQALFALPFAGQGERRFFALGEDEADNEAAVLALAGRADVTCYCRSEGPDEGLPRNVRRFSAYDCCARLYWQRRPWDPAGERAVLLGDGRHARALLEQGLLTAPPGCRLELFGDWTAWRESHWGLAEWPAAGEMMRFHGESWRAAEALLRDASRIVVCGDDPAVNREALDLLGRLYPTKAVPDALGAPGLRRANGFGEPAELFTPELVLREALDRRARWLHEAYRAGADYPVPAWEDLPDFQKRSNLAAADHLLTKLRLLLPEEDVREIAPGACARAADRWEAASPEAREAFRRIEHDRWALFHALYNWRGGKKRDDAARIHPLMVPYEALSEAERRKDDNAWRLLRAISEEGEV